MILRALVLTILVLPVNAFAGVTIHFKGQLTDTATPEEVAEAACAAAESHSWRCVPVSSPSDPALDHITIESLRELDGTNNLSSANGVVIYPAEMSEPLYLVFGGKGKLDNFIKTQFAGVDTHIDVINLLDAVKPFFKLLDIIDEGRYWETRSRDNLEEDMESVASQIAEIKLRHSKAFGPVKRPDGRILDLVANEH